MNAELLIIVAIVAGVVVLAVDSFCRGLARGNFIAGIAYAHEQVQFAQVGMHKELENTPNAEVILETINSIEAGLRALVADAKKGAKK